MIYLSPLRYPGGKAKLAPYLARVIANQSKPIETYCEPYAGGAGAGLKLLVDGNVDKLIINDLNPGIAAFWRTVFAEPQRLIKRIERTIVNLDTWHQQRTIYTTPSGKSDIDLGFATFFLNRSNRSGILSARPIGGMQQTGEWKIDARFNKLDLIARIELLSQYRSKVQVCEIHAIELIRRVNRRSRPVLLYADPPYVVPGEELYMSKHSWNDHRKLAACLSASPHPWILTYDVDDRTRELYRNFRCLKFGISHTAQVQKVGREFMFFSRGLRVPDKSVLRTEGEWVATTHA